jgi:hypothetical protein
MGGKQNARISDSAMAALNVVLPKIIKYTKTKLPK